jgi:hypothetical protein
LIPTSLRSGIVSSRLCSFLQTFAFSASFQNGSRFFSIIVVHQHSVWVGRSFEFLVSSLLLAFSFAECMPHDSSCVVGILSSMSIFGPS